MALVLADGFETYATQGNLQQQWNVGTAQLSGIARTGNASVSSYLTSLSDPSFYHATFIAGAAVYYGNIAGGTIFKFLSDAGATVHITIQRNSDSTISILRGATVLATSTTHFLPADSAWRYIEAKVLLSDTVGTVDVYMNGDPDVVLSYGPGDTKNGGTSTTFEQVTFGSDGSNSHFVDDVYLCNGAGGAPYDTRLGEVRCWPITPSGNGNSSMLVGSDSNSTDNYLLVDETPLNLNTADYVGSAVNDDKDTYVYSNLTPTTGTVVSVRVATQGSKTDGGAKSIKPVVRHGATEHDGTAYPLATDTTRTQQVYETNPVTAVAWTISDVNNAEFGVKVAA